MIGRGYILFQHIWKKEDEEKNTTQPAALTHTHAMCVPWKWFDVVVLWSKWIACADGKQPQINIFFFVSFVASNKTIWLWLWFDFLLFFFRMKKITTIVPMSLPMCVSVSVWRHQTKTKRAVRDAHKHWHIRYTANTRRECSLLVKCKPLNVVLLYT